MTNRLDRRWLALGLIANVARRPTPQRAFGHYLNLSSIAELQHRCVCAA